jgi:hypothetical protein
MKEPEGRCGEPFLASIALLPAAIVAALGQAGLGDCYGR